MCGKIAVPHLLQATNFTGFLKWWLRRMLRLVLVCRRFGTAIDLCVGKILKTSILVKRRINPLLLLLQVRMNGDAKGKGHRSSMRLSVPVTHTLCAT